jgi:hypothetical protein
MHSHVVQLSSLYFIRNNKKTISTHLFSEAVLHGTKWFIITGKSHNKIQMMTNLIKVETYLRVIPTIGTAKNGLVKKLHVLALAGR